VNDFFVRFALTTQQPLSEVMTWDPEMLATAGVWLEERREAQKAAAKGR